MMKITDKILENIPETPNNSRKLFKQFQLQQRIFQFYIFP
jgi:hypothetical protein